MSTRKVIVIFSLVMAGCTSSQSMRDSDFIYEPQKPLMRHSIRQLSNLDSLRMAKLVNKELNLKEKNEDVFLRNVTTVLAQTALVHPHYVERDAALREIKTKLDPEDYIVVLENAASDLLYFSKSSVPSDQATAIVGLRNWVREAKGLHREELNPMLKKVAEAHVEASQAAQQYAMEPMASVDSPSDEADPNPL